MEADNNLVLATELKNLKEIVISGFSNLKELIQNGASSLAKHETEDKETHEALRKEIETLKLDMVKFKERWLLIGSAISVVGAGLIEFIVHAAIK